MQSVSRVAVLHRRRLVREVLAALLAQQPDLRASVVAASAADRSLQNESLPHLFVIDLGLPEALGLQDAREIRRRYPQVPILMIGVSESEDEVLACCEAGATGYLTAELPPEEFVRQVRAAAQGETVCSARVAAFLFACVGERVRQVRGLAPRETSHLTRREIEVLSLIERGLSNKEIASQLQLQLQTVKNHVHNILDKLKLRGGRWVAVRYARERGLLPEPTVAPEPSRTHHRFASTLRVSR